MKKTIIYIAGLASILCMFLLIHIKTEAVEDTTWQNDYEYWLDEENHIIRLCNFLYKGNGVVYDIIVPLKAVINGTEYTTCISPSYFHENWSRDWVFFPEDNISSFSTEPGVLLENCRRLFELDSGSYRYELTEVDLSNIVVYGSISSMKNMFYRCCNIESLDLTNIDTSNVETMEGMFYDCKNLKSLNISTFDTSNVVVMADMFSGCNKLKTIDVSNFNTANVGYMSMMFYQCLSLETLDVSGFDTSNVEKMYGMFGACNSIKSLDLSNFNTDKLIDTYIGGLNRGAMAQMFFGCSSLEELKISSFNTQNIKDFSGMFCGCRSLKSLDLRNFDTGNAETMADMFLGCSKLESLDLSGFNASKVTNTENMFRGCESLKEIDVSSFVTLSNGMFRDCKSLKALDLSSFKIKSKVDMNPDEYTFENCKNLKAIKTPTTVYNNYGDYGILPYTMRCTRDGEEYIYITDAPDNVWIYAFIDISDAEATIEGYYFVYDGNEKKPRVTVNYGGELLTENTDYTITYSNNVNPGKASITITGLGTYIGETKLSFDIVEDRESKQDEGNNQNEDNKQNDDNKSKDNSDPQVTTVTMLRLYNPNSGEHFYTASEREKKALVKQGWNYEGIAWEGPSWSNTPVYRLYNESAGDHHYTPSKKERDSLVKVGWKDEGIGWYSNDAKTKSLYRLYNPNASTGSHHYTTSTRERDQLVKQGWKDEGIGWYGY